MSIEGTGKGNEGDGLDPSGDEALWRLLGQARSVEAGPYFSRRVLREVALGEQASGRAVGGWLSGLRRALRRPGAAVWPGAMAVGIFWLSVVLTTNPSAARHGRSETPVAGKPAVPETAVAGSASDHALASVAADEVVPQDVEVIADLDNLITREENRLWADDTARF